MISSLKGMANAGGGTTIKRRFPVAPGETIEKGDVVSIFNNQAYKNSAVPVPSLPRFSPDVLYLPSRTDAAAVHAISDEFFLHLGQADQEIAVTLCQMSSSGILERAKKSIFYSSVEGLAHISFKPLGPGTGVIFYQEHNTQLWTFVSVDYSDHQHLLLGTPTRYELFAGGVPQIEAVTSTSFLVAWLCMRVAPKRYKVSLFSFGGEKLETISKGQDVEVESGNYIDSVFAMSKLDSTTFAITCRNVVTEGYALITRVIRVPGTEIVLGGRAVKVTSEAANFRIKQVSLTPTKLVIFLNLLGNMNLFLVNLSGDIPTFSDSITYSEKLHRERDSAFEMIRVSDDRFMIAYRPVDTSNKGLPGKLAVFQTTGSKLAFVCATELSKYSSVDNKFQLIALGSGMFVVSFNSFYSERHDYTQALLVKMDATMSQFDVISPKEQLTNLYDQGCFAEWFFLSPIGTTGRFLAAFRNRIKIFRCGWTGAKFISSGVGEFQDISGDMGVEGAPVKAVVLSNGFTVVAYRERDTWHGKLSAFREASGALQPIFSHTFSYSHVDNLSLIEIAPGKIGLQYRQRKYPIYDDKQYGGEHELKLMVAEVTENGLQGKSTIDLDPADVYRRSWLFPLDNGRILVAGINSGLNVFSTVFQYQEKSTGFVMVPIGEKRIMAYERANIEIFRLGPRLFSVLDYSGYLFEVKEDYSVVKLNNWIPGNPDFYGIAPWEDDIGYLLTDSTSTSGRLSITKLAYLDGWFRQAGKARTLSEIATKNIIQFQKLGNRLFLLYVDNAINNSAVGEPNQNVSVALVGFDEENDAVNSRFHSFPAAANMAPLFVPIDDRRAFVVAMDCFQNQTVTVAYLDDHYLSYGRPFLSPGGVAANSGAEGEYIEVVENGIANFYEDLMTGAMYYTDQNGKVSTKANTRKVGVAISPSELYVNGLVSE